jgi:hypothetical protein
LETVSLSSFTKLEGIFSIVIFTASTRVADNPPEVAPSGDVIGGDRIPNGDVLRL